MSTEAPSVERLVKVYLKMNAARTALRTEYEEKESVLKTKMDKVKQALLQHCKDHNVESVRTGEGMFFRTVKTTYWTSDWESMNKFILEQQVPELLEKRIHQGNMKKFLEDNPDLLPMGLNVDSEYSVTVRRK